MLYRGCELDCYSPYKVLPQDRDVTQRQSTRRSSDNGGHYWLTRATLGRKQTVLKHRYRRWLNQVAPPTSGTSLFKNRTENYFLYEYMYLSDNICKACKILFGFANRKWAASWENQQFAIAKTKAQISVAATVKLISAFVFSTQIVLFLFFLNPKFPAASLLLLLCRLVCIWPGWKLIMLVFSCEGSVIKRLANKSMD